MQTIKRHPLLFFFPLAFILSWYPWVIVLLRGSGNGGPNPLGVFLAAIITTGLTLGKPGMKDLFSRLVRVRAGLQWYAVIFLFPVAACILAAALLMLFGSAQPDFTKIPPATDVIERFIFIFLFIGLGEEPGWRGYALDQLQKKRTPVVASAILAAIWAFWHLPLMGTEFKAPVIPAFILSVFAGTYIQTWIYNNTNRSILLQMLFHSTINAVGAGAIFPLFSGADFVLFWYIYALLWMLVAAAIVLTGRLNPSQDQPRPLPNAALNAL